MYKHFDVCEYFLFVSSLGDREREVINSLIVPTKIIKYGSVVRAECECCKHKNTSMISEDVRGHFLFYRLQV